MRHWAALPFLVLPVLAAAQGSPRIAIVPPIHVADNVSDSLARQQVGAIGGWLNNQFDSRGFRLIGSNEIGAAVRAMKIDPFAPDQFKAGQFLELGKRLRADVIVVSVLRSSRAVRVERPRFNDVEGQVSLQMWLIDVTREVVLVDGKSFEGRQGGTPDYVDFRGNEVQIAAAQNAVQRGLQDYLKQFPVQPRRRRS